MNEIRRKIGEGEIDESIKLLYEKFIFNKDLTKRNQLLLIKSQYSRWKSDDIKGLNPSRNEINKIISNLLEICDETKGESIDAESVELGKNNLKPVFVFILVVVISIFVYLNYNNNSAIEFNFSESDDFVMNTVSEKIGLELLPIFEKSYLRGIDDNDYDVIKSAKLIISDLRKIKNNELNITSNLYRNLGLSVCYKIIALSSNISQYEVEYANKCITSSNKGLEIARSIRDENFDLGDDELEQEIKQWMISDHLEENFQTLLLISNCIKKLNGDKTVRDNEIESLFLSLSHNNFLEKEGYLDYPILKSTLKL